MTIMDMLVGAVSTTPGRLDNLLTPLIDWFRWKECYGPICLEEVVGDIIMLRGHKNISAAEKRKDSTLRKIVQKYKQSYCPDSHYKSFTKEDKFRYFCLRLQIDELLEDW